MPLWTSCPALGSLPALISPGYWQVELNPEDREDCVFFWKRIVVFMGIGLKNARPTFQCLVELALNGFDWQYVLVYIDDFCLFSPILPLNTIWSCCVMC